MSESRVWQVVTTTDSEEEANRLATGLIEEHLAACVQVDGPVTSTYRWEGKATCEVEWRLTIKTSAARYDAMAKWLVDRHSYDVPELLASEVRAGHGPYLDWVLQQTGAVPEGRNNGTTNKRINE